MVGEGFCTDVGVDGQLRADEVLRTYAFCWLIGPGIMGPLILPFLIHGNQDQPSLWVLVGGLLGGISAGGAILGMLLTVYRKR
ncbi:hypothetical protein ABT120_58175 [Nonomuraea angiospora]|uniref:hypothetical protein n=1 Tax=Nonomuraea angiospora TaxID=46172 RepID=UPI00332DEC68